jgi:hypothetical protein
MAEPSISDRTGSSTSRSGKTPTRPMRKRWETFSGKILANRCRWRHPERTTHSSTQPSESNRAIWALGLRNPFTFVSSLEPGGCSSTMSARDTWEEINEGVRGRQFMRWPPAKARAVHPISAIRFTSTRTRGLRDCRRCLYNPATLQFPSQYTGVYFFADLCSAWIRILDPNNGNQIFDVRHRVVESRWICG